MVTDDVSDQTTPPPPPSPPPPAPPAAAPPATGTGAAGKGPGALGIGGWIFAVIAMLVALLGLGAVAIHATQRDGNGFYTSSLTRIQSAGHAVYATGLELDTNAGAQAAGDVLGDVRIRARAPDGRPVFVGIARQADVDEYLAGVPRSKVDELDGTKVTYVQRPGDKEPRDPPIEEPFWQAKARGAGRVTLNWTASTKGDFTVVVMNADASAPVRAVVTVGAKAPIILYIGLGLLVLALILGAVGFAMIRSDKRSRTRAAG